MDFWINVGIFAFTLFLSDRYTWKIWGQRIQPGSGDHPDILHGAKDDGDDHTDVPSDPRGARSGWRLGHPSQPFPLHLLSCLSAIFLWNQFQYVCRHPEERCPAGTPHFCWALSQILLATCSSYMIHFAFQKWMTGQPTKEAQAHHISSSRLLCSLQPAHTSF